LMLVIAYYGIVTPTALIKKIFGASPLPLTPDPSVTTYWREREEPAQPKGRFIKRY